jgi:uncharacterized membrane protein
MDRSSFPDKKQDKSFYSNGKKEDVKYNYSGGQTQSSSIPANSVNASYINECMEDVCLNGNSLVVYKKQIEKLYPNDTDIYTKCESFLDEVNSSVKAKKFSATSVRNLKYLGEEIYLPSETIQKIVNYYQTKFEEEIQLKRQREKEKEKQKRIAEEEERRKQREEEERRKQRDEEERIKKGIETINNRYITGTAIAMLTSLICIALNGWCIFISCVTMTGSAFIIPFWYKFVEKQSAIPKYFKGIIWTAGILFLILFAVIFFISHSWWSLFSILLIGAFGLIVQWVYDEL